MDQSNRAKELPYIKILTILGITWMSIGLVALGYWLLSYVSNIVFLVLLGVVVAVGLSSLAEQLRRRVPRLPRWAAIVFVYIALLLVMVIVAVIVGVPLVEQSTQLLNNYPRLTSRINDRLLGLQRLLAARGVETPDMSNATGRLTGLASQYGREVFQGFLGFVVIFSSGVSQFILVVVVSLYLLIEQDSISESLVGSVSERHRARVISLGHELKSIISSFLGGQLLLAATMGILAALFSMLLGMPYAALIGVFVAVTGLIPIVGSFLGAVPPLIIAYSVAPWKALAFLVFFAALSQFVSYYLQPKIVGKAIGLNPLTILIALLVGLQMVGFWGAIFAAPVVSVGFALVRHIIDGYKEYAQA